MTKVVYIISNINKSLAFEWVATSLPSEKIQHSFILLNPGASELESFLKNQRISCISLHYQGFRDLPKAIIKLFRIFRASKPEVIHCHLIHATLAGLVAGWLAGVKRRIYTRHHSTYNWEFNKKGVWFDRLINWLATDIVAISENVKRVLLDKEKVNVSKIHLIHHGFDLKAFSKVEKERIEFIGNNYNPDKKSPVIGVIARWIAWKGIQYIIPAFKKLLATYPDALLILANANGQYKPEIEQQLAELPKGSYQIIPFENDLFALYQLFDIYVHVPINPRIEAFGQTYVEALAAGIPSVFTLSGVAPEFIEHEKNALVVPFGDNEAIYEAMVKLLNDRSLSTKLSKNGRSAVHRFDLKQMIDKLQKLYEV
jgi:glycosyltransferase involved in cell wall biosynthesis